MSVDYRSVIKDCALRLTAKVHNSRLSSERLSGHLVGAEFQYRVGIGVSLGCLYELFPGLKEEVDEEIGFYLEGLS